MSDGPNSRILIAEDDADLRTLVATALRRDGYEVIEAFDGAQALELAGSNPVALAVLDINMPRVDGVEVAERLRAGEEGPPVIFITAHTRRASLDRALETGPVGCIAKPFELEQLREQVRRALAA